MARPDQRRFTSVLGLRRSRPSLFSFLVPQAVPGVSAFVVHRTSVWAFLSWCSVSSSGPHVHLNFLLVSNRGFDPFPLRMGHVDLPEAWVRLAAMLFCDEQNISVAFCWSCLGIFFGFLLWWFWPSLVSLGLPFGSASCRLCSVSGWLCSQAMCLSSPICPKIMPLWYAEKLISLCLLSRPLGTVLGVSLPVPLVLLPSYEPCAPWVAVLLVGFALLYW